MTSIADLYGLRSSSRRSPPHIVCKEASYFQRMNLYKARPGKTLLCSSTRDKQDGEQRAYRSSSRDLPGSARLFSHWRRRRQRELSLRVVHAVMWGSDPFVLRWRFKPTGDLGSAWDGCADTADIPSAPPASSAPPSPQMASAFHTNL